MLGFAKLSKRSTRMWNKNLDRLCWVSSLLLALAAFTSVSHAAEDAPKRGTAVSLLFGIEAGPLSSKPKDANIEGSKQGYALGGHAVVNLSSDKIGLDLGVGWLDSKITGSAPNPAPGESETESVRTRMGYAEAAGRYKLTKQFELGLMARMSFGTDSTFSTSLDADIRPNVFAGPQVVYDISSSRSMLARVGAFFLTDFSITDRQIYWFGLSADIGMPITRGDVVIQKETQIKYKERNRYIIDAEVVNFVTASSELSDAAQRYLQTLAQYLVKNPGIWERLVVSGHADQRGSDELNNQLAQSRAATVKNLLLSQGIPEDRLVVRTFGSHDPLENDAADVALARNRRVELFFIGKVNVQALRTGLIRIKQVTAMPETCVGEECR